MSIEMTTIIDTVRVKALELAIVYKPQAFNEISLMEIADLFYAYLSGENTSDIVDKLEVKYAELNKEVQLGAPIQFANSIRRRPLI